MIDLLFMLSGVGLVACLAAIGYWVEHRDRCRHKWTKWDDPENTGVNVIQRRSCEKCNLQESRVMIANASIETCEEDHVAVPPVPTDTVDQKAGA
jgi:hypothetical protein